MKAYTYIEKGRFELFDKPKPALAGPKDALVRVSEASAPAICISSTEVFPEQFRESP